MTSSIEDKVRAAILLWGNGNIKPWEVTRQTKFEDVGMDWFDIVRLIADLASFSSSSPKSDPIWGAETVGELVDHITQRTRN